MVVAFLDQTWIENAYIKRLLVHTYIAPCTAELTSASIELLACHWEPMPTAAFFPVHVCTVILKLESPAYSVTSQPST